MAAPIHITLDIDAMPAEQIPATLAQLAAAQTALAARLMSAPAPTAPTVQEQDRMLTVAELSERLRCAPKTVYRRAGRGEFPFARRLGRKVLFSEQGLTKWLARQKA